MRNVLYLSIGFFIGICSFFFVNFAFADIIISYQEHPTGLEVDNNNQGYYQYFTPVDLASTTAEVVYVWSDNTTDQTIHFNLKRCDYGTINNCVSYSDDYYLLGLGTGQKGFILDNPVTLSSSYTYKMFVDHGSASFKYYGKRNEITGVNYCVPVQAGRDCVGENDSLYYIFADSGGLLATGETRIEDVTPAIDSQVATSTSFEFGVDGYISTADYTDGYNVFLRYTQATGMSLRGNSWIAEQGEFEWDLSQGGYFDVSTTTSLISSGEYVVIARLRKPMFTLFGHEFFNKTVDQVYYKFTAATSTDQEKKVALLSIVSVLGTTASTTQGTSGCGSFISGDFDIGDCLYSIFIPETEFVVDKVTDSMDGFLTYFPIGYVTDFFNILATSTQASSLGIEATVPNGIPGSGSHISLALSSSTLDYIYDADIGTFVTATEDDTRTLYEITYDYWEWIVYILLTLYIIRRVLGSEVINSGVTQEIKRGKIHIRNADQRISRSNIKSLDL